MEVVISLTTSKGVLAADELRRDLMGKSPRCSNPMKENPRKRRLSSSTTSSHVRSDAGNLVNFSLKFLVSASWSTIGVIGGSTCIFSISLQSIFCVEREITSSQSTVKAPYPTSSACERLTLTLKNGWDFNAETPRTTNMLDFPPPRRLLTFRSNRDLINECASLESHLGN